MSVFGRFSNIMTIFMLIALVILLTLAPTHPRLDQAFWVVAALFIAHLAVFVYRQRLLARRAARRLGEARHFLVSTDCLLDWTDLARNVDNLTRRLLRGLVNCGPQDGRALRPGLEKVLPRLKRLMRRLPHDPGPPALRGWGLALLSRVTTKESLDEHGLAIPEHKWWAAAQDLYAQAVRLAPDEARLRADWGRILEDRAELVAEGGETGFEWHLGQALEKYEQAVELDPALAPAWRGQGRVLGRMAQSADRSRARTLLVRAVESYERARPGLEGGGAFDGEFGQALVALATVEEKDRGVPALDQAAGLFRRAAERDGNRAGDFLRAGQALYQAAGLLADEPEAAAGRYQEALALLKQAIEAAPAEVTAYLWAARCLLALHQNIEAGEDGLDFLEEACQLCAQAAQTAPGEEVWSDWANILSVMAENGGERAGELWAETARKYAAAAACAQVPPDRAAVNWHNWAYALSCLAESRPSTTRRRKLLLDAGRKYEQAARLNGDNLTTLKNWGDILGELSALEDDPAEKDRLYEAAVGKFRQAAQLYPDRAGPWRRWSALIQERARAEQNPGRRRDLWQSAITKLEKAVRAEPDDPVTWVIWGRVLEDLYWESPEYERPLLVAGAIEKYETALRLDPRDDDTWNLLGGARLEAAELPEENAPAGGLLQQAHLAADHFKTACDLNPDDPDHWAKWGQALFKIAQIVDNEASALAALKEAEEKYLTAVALDPGEGEYHTGLSHIFYQWGWRVEDPEARRIQFQKAYDHCAEAGQLSAHDPTVWRNWAKVAEALAGLEIDPRLSVDWQNEANEKYYYADTLETPASRPRRH